MRIEALEKMCKSPASTARFGPDADELMQAALSSHGRAAQQDEGAARGRGFDPSNK